MAEGEPFARRPPRSELMARLQAFDASPAHTMRDLVKAAGLRHDADLRFGDFAGCPFDGEDLRGFDFTRCDLAGATFVGARIKSAIFDCARYDPNALRAAKDYRQYLQQDSERPAGKRHRLLGSELATFDSFVEAPFVPEMVVLPAGEFDMGSGVEEAALGEDDKAFGDEIVPGRGKRRMRIPQRFAIGKYPVTFEEYDAFADAKGRERPGAASWVRARRPVINVSWEDATAYVGWLNERLGIAAYRLPSEAEWEYACRAGTTTRRWWGDDWDPARANGNRDVGVGTSPVDAFPANPWGLHDTIGNVWEWCADVYVDNIGELPEGGVPFGLPKETSGRNTKKRRSKTDSSSRVLRGGAWNDTPKFLRAACRVRNAPSNRDNNAGFRVARTLLP